MSIFKKKQKRVHVIRKTYINGELFKTEEGNLNKKDLVWLPYCENKDRSEIVTFKYEIIPLTDS